LIRWIEDLEVERLKVVEEWLNVVKGDKWVFRGFSRFRGIPANENNPCNPPNPCNRKVV